MKELPFAINGKAKAQTDTRTPTHTQNIRKTCPVTELLKYRREGGSKGKQHFAHIGKVFGKRYAILGAFSPLISICSIRSLLHFPNFILICSKLAVSQMKKTDRAYVHL